MSRTPFRAPSLLVLASLSAAIAVPAARASAAETWVTVVPPSKGGAPALPPPTPAAGAKGKSKAAKPSSATAASPLPRGAFAAGDGGFVELTTGRFPAAGAAVRAERIDRTYLRIGAGGGRPMPLTGARVDGAATRLEATYAGAGLAAVAIQLVPEYAEVKAEEFEALLAENGCTAAQDDRKKKKETKKAGKLVTIASTKTFTSAVDPRAKTPPSLEGAAEGIPLPFELVLDSNPLSLSPGRPFGVTLLRDGQPTPDAAIRVFVDGTVPFALRTGPDGMVSVSIDRPGPFLLAAATVRRTGKDDRKKGEAWKKADWEAATTTVRLEANVPPPAPAAAPTPTPKPAKKPKKK
jgi:hypothetical protein